MAEPTTLHYRGDGPDAYAQALLALVHCARTTTDDFSFGPISLIECQRDGLSVTGPDLGAAIAVLSVVPGLAHLDTTTGL